MRELTEKQYKSGVEKFKAKLKPLSGEEFLDLYTEAGNRMVANLRKKRDKKK